jgi:hypothetical protein
MKITTINVPTYKVKGYKKVINHFELIKLQTDIANRKKKGNVQVKCITTGKWLRILDSGRIRSTSEAYELITSLSKELEEAIKSNPIDFTASEKEIECLLWLHKSDAIILHKDRTGKSFYEARIFIHEFVKSYHFKSLYSEKWGDGSEEWIENNIKW